MNGKVLIVILGVLTLSECENSSEEAVIPTGPEGPPACRKIFVASEATPVPELRGLWRASWPPGSCADFSKFEWEKVNLENTASVIASGNTVVLYNAQGLFFSRNSGDTWSFIPCPPLLRFLTGTVNPVPIALISEEPIEGYLGTGGNLEMLYRFTANGCESLRSQLPFEVSNWTRRSGFNGIGVMGIAVNPTDRNEAWFSGEDAVWHTRDRGQTIEVLFRGPDLRIWDIALDPFDNSTLYAVGEECDSTCFEREFQEGWVPVAVRIESDGTWERWDGPPSTWFRSVAADPTRHNHFYALASARASGLWESLDGRTWQQVAQRPPRSAPRKLLIDDSFIVTEDAYTQIGEHSWHGMLTCVLDETGSSFPFFKDPVTGEPNCRAPGWATAVGN